MRFTRKTLSALTLPPGKPYAIFWDDELPGFGVRLNPGSKTWVVQYRIAGQTRRQTIGKLDAIALDMARSHARQILARVQLGGDPHTEKAEARARRALTFETVADRYLKAAAARLKPRSYEEVSRHLRKHWSTLADVPLSSIDRKLVAAQLEDLAERSGPIAANRARASISALYSFALGLGLCDVNPVIGTIKPGREIKRDHVIADRDIPSIWRACGNGDYGRIIKLLLLTGQRRDEVGSMLWSEVDLDGATWTLPATRTKNRRAHEVPLSSQGIAILRNTPRILGRDFIFGGGEFGFSGWSKGKSTLDKQIAEMSGVRESWRIHDLRRTAATGMAILGVPPHVVEAVLNHISGTRAGVAGIYNRATYREEKREALSIWGQHIERLVTS